MPTLNSFSLAIGDESSSWEIGDISVVELDTSLRNVIRTNATDIEVWARDSSVQYRQGRDFTVSAPAGFNNVERLNTSELDPYIVKRVPSGRIPARARVQLSYDYLPGKVDVQGHSTPNALSEPGYYAFMDVAISHVAQTFPTLRYRPHVSDGTM